jgi:hypothetical protein
MPDQSTFPLIDTALERLLFAIVKRERLARDTGDWAGLEGLYWPRSRVRVTWFDGPIEDFVEQSRRPVRPGRVNGFHTVDPVRASQHGDRAVVESRGQILLRPSVEGVECDLVSWCRFVSGFERRGDEWRMAFLDNIYVKDAVVPTDPGKQVVADAALLAQGRTSYAWLTYTNVRRGMSVPDDLPGDDRPDLVAAFWEDVERWVAGGPWGVPGAAA